MNGRIIVGLAVIMLPTLLAVLSPLINQILDDDVINLLNNAITNVEYFIGSENTNLFFACLGIILVMPIIRRIFSFFTGDKN